MAGFRNGNGVFPNLVSAVTLELAPAAVNRLYVSGLPTAAFQIPGCTAVQVRAWAIAMCIETKKRISVFT